MSGAKAIAVSVVYALPERQWCLAVRLDSPATVRQAIEGSGLLEHFPRLLAQSPPVGIFHRRCTLETLLRDGDQVQIYRPLQMDPKDARRLRAERARRELRAMGKREAA
jgi:putative ubiquitin-RnfH superfamily antitoxin RatB of RatAB toxin-antitoxin module